MRVAGVTTGVVPLTRGSLARHSSTAGARGSGFRGIGAGPASVIVRSPQRGVAEIGRLLGAASGFALRRAALRALQHSMWLLGATRAAVRPDPPGEGGLSWLAAIMMPLAAFSSRHSHRVAPSTLKAFRSSDVRFLDLDLSGGSWPLRRCPVSSQVSLRPRISVVRHPHPGRTVPI